MKHLTIASIYTEGKGTTWHLWEGTTACHSVRTLTEEQARFLLKALRTKKTRQYIAGGYIERYAVVGVIP